jgi:hypothetical protein
MRAWHQAVARFERAGPEHQHARDGGVAVADSRVAGLAYDLAGRKAANALMDVSGGGAGDVDRFFRKQSMLGEGAPAPTAIIGSKTCQRAKKGL